MFCVIQKTILMLVQGHFPEAALTPQKDTPWAAGIMGLEDSQILPTILFITSPECLLLGTVIT
jgi:hypothetical protein